MFPKRNYVHILKSRDGMDTISGLMKMSTDGKHLKPKCGLLLPDYDRLKVFKACAKPN